MLEAVKKKVLTVGDGDLTLSLALSRAYGDHVDVTASVLEPDRREFLRVFPEAPLEELHHRQVSVLYGVDATQLQSRCAYFEKKLKSNKNFEKEIKISKAWDLVSFHHPHLGVSNIEDGAESIRAILHHRLLCHYFHSAKQVSKLIHICLTGTQPTTWKLMEAAKLQNLILVKTLPDSKPFANVWMNIREDGCNDKSIAEIRSIHEILPELAKVEPHFAAPRRYRNGKLGRHSLARYGYRHRRTEGVMFKGSSKDANVSKSMHFVFANKCSSDRQDDSIHNAIRSDTCKDSKGEVYVCAICNELLETECALKKHIASPVRPPVSPEVNQSSITPDGDQHSHFRNESEQNLNVKCAYPPAVERSRKAVLQHHCDERLGTILIVSNHNHGKRLRWYLHHSKISDYKFTKRLAESTIQAGLVLVNGHVALDSSRILQVQDKVTIMETKEEDTAGKRSPKEKATTRTVMIQKLASKNPQVQIVKRSSTSSLKWLVALKSSGMRTKGNIPGTLESIVSEQEEEIYSCVSSLETSCSGLCVLVNTTGNEIKSTSQSYNDCREGNISVMHTLTVLVHGELPKDMWSPSRTVSLTLEAKWRQKKNNKKRKHVPESLSKPQEDKQFRNMTHRVVSAEIKLKESRTILEKKSPSYNTGLSTLQVVTPEPSSSSICHYFRQEGFPVVGDSFCKQEYSKLKRSIRNRLKNKLCIGCFSVEIKITEAKDELKELVEIQSPNKLSAIFWEKFLKEEIPAPERMHI